MNKKKISNGVVHNVPSDLKNIFLSEPNILNIWQDLTPLARNEWLCWIESVKKSETRDRHITIMQDKLLKGDRRPCCWAGCPHRK